MFAGFLRVKGDPDEEGIDDLEREFGIVKEDQERGMSSHLDRSEIGIGALEIAADTSVLQFAGTGRS